jgi:hypothetical protein
MMRRLSLLWILVVTVCPLPATELTHEGEAALRPTGELLHKLSVHSLMKNAVPANKEAGADQVNSTAGSLRPAMTSAAGTSDRHSTPTLVIHRPQPAIPPLDEGIAVDGG